MNGVPVSKNSAFFFFFFLEKSSTACFPVRDPFGISGWRAPISFEAVPTDTQPRCIESPTPPPPAYGLFRVAAMKSRTFETFQCSLPTCGWRVSSASNTDGFTPDQKFVFPPLRHSRDLLTPVPHQRTHSPRCSGRPKSTVAFNQRWLAGRSGG